MKVDYLRVSVTDRCNFRCFYCMPYGSIFLKDKSELLSFEEIKKIVEVFSSFGVKKIRFTGGEPFMRKGFISLLKMVLEVDEIEKIGITTNGFFVNEFIEELKSLKKISSINVSLDTLRRDRFKRITGVDGFERVINNIELMREKGIGAKVNVVLIKGINDDEIEEFVLWGADKGIDIRFIEFMSFRPRGKMGNYKELPMVRGDEVITHLTKKFTLRKINGSGKAEEFLIGELGSKISIIFSNSEKGCNDCSKLRITPEGKLIPCLKSSISLDLKKILSQEKMDIYNKISSVLNLKNNLPKDKAIPSSGMNLIGG